MKKRNLKIPQKGTTEFDVLMHFLQIIEGAATAFLTRAGVNVIAKNAILKEILTWALGIILFFSAIFFRKSPASSHLKTMALGVILEAMNRTILKRLEKTEFGQKMLQGDDEIVLSENEMEAILEKRIQEDKALNGLDDPDDPDDPNNEPETTMKGDTIDEEEDPDSTMQGDNIVENIISLPV